MNNNNNYELPLYSNTLLLRPKYELNQSANLHTTANKGSKLHVQNKNKKKQ